MAKSHICSRCFEKSRHKTYPYCKECKNIKNQEAIKKQCKILCPRGKGTMINKRDCVPGCNDACEGCEHNVELTRRQKRNEVSVGGRSAAGLNVVL